MTEEEKDNDALIAGMAGAGVGTAGALGYYGAKALSKTPAASPVQVKTPDGYKFFQIDTPTGIQYVDSLDPNLRDMTFTEKAMLDALPEGKFLEVVDDASPFIDRPLPDIPDVEGGFGSPSQRRAASEASAAARGVRKAVNPQSLYVPEFAPDGSRQPLDYEGRSRFRDYMKTPGMSNPNKGKLFDYVPEGTVSLLEEEARLQRSAEQARRAMNSPVLSSLERMKAANAYDEAGRRIESARRVIFELGGLDSEIVKRQFESGKIGHSMPFGLANTSVTPDLGFEDEYRKMAADEFGQKIEKGLDNARRYLDESFVARELMTKKPVPGPSTGPGGRTFRDPSRLKKMASIMGVSPDPTDLALLALAGPYEMMYGTQIGQEPGTGTFGIPLGTTLGKASELAKRPLLSKDINVDTRIRLADDDYPLASQLYTDGVLSAEAFDIITRIRKARGGDTTVLPPAPPEPPPEPTPSIGRPGRRF